MITIYHNTRCSKSRSALQLLEEKGIPHRIRLYLQDPLSKGELEVLLSNLGMEPSSLLRRSEPIYKELSASSRPEDQWLELMVRHPQLIERPIVDTGKRAVVARPPERLLEIL